jgi:hypothetical protein
VSARQLSGPDEGVQRYVDQIAAEHRELYVGVRKHGLSVYGWPQGQEAPVARQA